MARKERNLICEDCGEQFGTTTKGISFESELCPACREYGEHLDALQYRIDSGDTRGTGIAAVAG